MSYFDELRLRLLTYTAIPDRGWHAALDPKTYNARATASSFWPSGGHDDIESSSKVTEGHATLMRPNERRAEADYVYSRKRAAYILSLLDDPNTKRMIFSAAQMRQFQDAGSSVPDSYRKLLRLPFDQYWMEFDEPIQISEQEPGRDDKYLRGFFIQNAPVDNVVPNGYVEWGERTLRPAIQCVAFYVEGDPASPEFFTDEAFQVELSTGRVFGSLRAIHETIDASVYPVEEHEVDIEHPRQGGWIFFGEGLDRPGRYVGWYERQALHLANLFFWTLTYIMAKGIHVVRIDAGRSERRRATRAGVIPQPWHVVQVEPRFSLVTGGTKGQIGNQHSYRYDVMGHLRFGRHKLGDGTYRDTVEFVRAHQRGLANSLYIPKTYNVKSGKTSHPIMDNYWEGTQVG